MSWCNLAKFLYYLYVLIAAIFATYLIAGYLGKHLSGLSSAERLEHPIIVQVGTE